MQRAAMILAIWAGLLGLTGAAHAGLTFCNKADVQHSFAFAYKDGENWRAKGWWNIDPGDCKLVLAGDLKRRYYYYRATANGRTFSGDNYYFCTEQSVFDIVGEQGNCSARGHDSSEFRKLDTGKSAKDFTLNLVPAGGDQSPPAPAPKSDASPPGTYGEPYSDNGVFQDCVTETEAPFCTFHSGGTKFFVNDDGRTNASLIRFMSTLLPATPIAVSGDLVAVFDSTAEVVLRDVTVRRAEANDRILEKMQGYWYAVDDPNAQFNILGGERENQYDGQIGGTDYISVQNWCGDFAQGGPYLYAREDDSQESYCYEVVEISDFSMTLMYLPRGNFLEYRKLD
jgi:uncharacterized membrane protein